MLDGVRLVPDSLPYTKYFNFDKGAAAMLVLGLYAPGRAARRSRGTAAGWAWRFAIIAVVVIAATVSVGYARWDPKLPSWWPMWLASMVFLTALPEETLFRGVIQEALHERLGESIRARRLAAVLAGALFGVAHAGGGWTYVGLSTIAGIGYGWIYAASRSLAASTAAHTALNLLHLLCFSYPALRVVPLPGDRRHFARLRINGMPALLLVILSELSVTYSIVTSSLGTTPSALALISDQAVGSAVDHLVGQRVGADRDGAGGEGEARRRRLGESGLSCFFRSASRCARRRLEPRLPSTTQVP